MPDLITEGFGATPLTNLSFSSGQSHVRVISPPANKLARLTLVKLVISHPVGGLIAGVFTPVTVIRGDSGLFVGSDGALRIPASLRFGLVVEQPVSSVELMAYDFITYANQEQPLVYIDRDIIAYGNKRIAISVGGERNLNTGTGGGGSGNVTDYSLTVLGSYEDYNEAALIPGTVGRSLPRFR